MFLLFTLITLTGAIAFNSCSDDSNPGGPIVIPEPNMSNFLKIDSGYVGGASAFLAFYSDDSLRTGYNRLYFVLHDSVSGELITDAHITIVPSNHDHASPVENPDEETSDGIFRGAMVYTQSFTDAPLHWQLKFLVHNHSSPGEPEGEVEFSTPRILDNPDLFKSIIMPDSTPLYLSYINPKTPVIGLNSFEFLINRNEPELFPPDGSYTIQMTPEFLANGHTTGNNVNPIGNSRGHYLGTINLDQVGSWRIKLKIIKNTLSYDTYFDITYLN